MPKIGLGEGYLTYDPGNNECFHPSEGGGLHAKELLGVVLNRCVGEQVCPLKVVCGVKHQEAEENGEGGCVADKLHKGATHDLSQLRDKAHSK